MGVLQNYLTALGKRSCQILHEHTGMHNFDRITSLPIFDEPCLGETMDGYILRLSSENMIPSSKLIGHIKGNYSSLSSQSNSQEIRNFFGDIPLPPPRRHILGHGFVDEISDPIRSLISLKSQRICPLCLLEGLPIDRLWSVRGVTACVRHGIELIDHCASCKNDISIRRNWINNCDCGFPFYESKLFDASEARIKFSQAVFHSRSFASAKMSCHMVDRLGVAELITILGLLLRFLNDHHGLKRVCSLAGANNAYELSLKVMNGNHDVTSYLFNVVDRSGYEFRRVRELIRECNFLSGYMYPASHLMRVPLDQSRPLLTILDDAYGEKLTRANRLRRAIDSPRFAKAGLVNTSVVLICNREDYYLSLDRFSSGGVRSSVRPYQSEIDQESWLGYFRSSFSSTAEIDYYPVSDFEWSIASSALITESDFGFRHRATFNSMLWALRRRGDWDGLSLLFQNKVTAKKAFERWRASGAWQLMKDRVADAIANLSMAVALPSTGFEVPDLANVSKPQTRGVVRVGSGVPTRTGTAGRRARRGLWPEGLQIYNRLVHNGSPTTEGSMVVGTGFPLTGFKAPSISGDRVDSLRKSGDDKGQCLGKSPESFRN